MDRKVRRKQCSVVINTETILTVLHNHFLQAFTSCYIELKVSFFAVRNLIVHIRHG